MKPLILSVALAAVVLTGARAQDAFAYPQKDVKVIVPYSAAGSVGAMARVFDQQAQALTDRNWGLCTEISPGLNGLYVPIGAPRPVIDRLVAICNASD